jgi:hypothetical protein
LATGWQLGSCRSCRLATGFFGNWISGISTKKSMCWAAASVAGWQLLGISLATAIHAFIQ